ncbi:ATP-dependent RecD-like DNA helicase [Streptomyces sp. YIM 121038]|uniref:helix-hairpin-helix domain-containing protein n=1 Tax=Streptomyces sp. YIM 121038 TaxID=2136401 RepID=UPI00116591D9|nr:helix-hairpin-helix domain-containing protein [Streptomyces sp. YIM 121038]QCX75447.1 ATP-dependent RecD-like DNA helicase [Streptomyces sp. YIM 121038]
MSTESAAAEVAEPEAPEAAAEPEAEAAPEADATPEEADAPEEAAGPDEDAGPEEADATGADDGSGSAADAEGKAEAGSELSEAEAELAAQRELRQRIEERKAAKEGPLEAGAKLQGTAADLLAAVRAVESGEKPVASAFREPQPVAPRRPAPEPVRRPAPEAPAAPAEPAADAVAAVAAVLSEGGAPAALAPRAAAALGEGADERLREDPWQLLRLPGVRPEQADGFARALLGDACGPGDERRGRALTVWLLEQAALAGHTALDADALTAALGQRAVPDPEEAAQGALAEGDVLVFQDALEDAPQVAPAAAPDGEGADPEAEATAPVRVLFGLERYAMAEESLADGLARVINSLPKEDGSGPDAEAWESAASAASGSAAELIRAVAAHGLVLHTGGEAARAEPAALVAAARSLGLRVCAAAHTADGQRRLAEHTGTGADDGEGAAEGAGTAVTVAGLLSGRQGPGRDADGALAVDLLVVLDAPQLDVEAAAMLVESLPDGARLVLSGDPGVLWSAGPGRVFADVLAARACPQIASRTPDPGPLGELVSGIGVGELTEVAAPDKEVVIVPVHDAADAIRRTVQLVADSVPRAIGVPAEHTQVITPGHGGAAGTRALNAALKERLNPGPGRFGGFDPGDRVAHAPVPGRTALGRVVRADAEGLHLECDGAPVVVAKERVEQSVRHAWAVTAHQAAGRRWPAAVVVLPGDAAAALTRPWVYAAFSRAERHLSVVQGVAQALPRAVAERPAKERTTRLRTLLRPQLPETD